MSSVKNNMKESMKKAEKAPSKKQSSKVEKTPVQEPVKKAEKKPAKKVVEPVEEKPVEQPVEEPKEQSQVSEETVQEEPKPKEKKKRVSRRQKHLNKFRKKYIEGKDIKYRGPLSYRHLRAFAWAAMVITMLIVVFRFANRLNGQTIFSEPVLSVMSLFGGLTTPLFLIATFSVILSGNKTYRQMVILYGGAFLGIGLGLLFAYYHYIVPIGIILGEDVDVLDVLTGTVLGNKLQVNVFSDLFALTAMHFFINYEPKKYFQGKKIYLFRLMVLIPIAYLITGTALKLAKVTGTLDLPIQVFFFLPTKSIIVHMMFFSISVWIKRRKKLFLRAGGTDEEYMTHIRTNRNAFDFSKQLVGLIAIFAFLDLILTAVFTVGFAVIQQTEDLIVILSMVSDLGFGQATGLIFAIPIVLLFNYTKSYKNPMIDSFIAVAGVILVLLTIIEGFYLVLRIFMMNNMGA